MGRTYGWLYLDAVSSIAESSPVGIFSDVFCQALTANTAFIRYLFMQQATIRENGYIQSAETDPATGKPLLLINKNGIEAVNALFQSITILGDSFFEGDILSGPLELNSRNPSNIINTYTFAAGTSAQGLHQYLQTLNQNSPVDGNYGGVPFVYFVLRTLSGGLGVACGLFDKDRHGVNIPGGFIAPATGNQGDPTNWFYIKNISNGNYYTLSYTVQIGFYNPQGRTFKLNDLPYNEPAMSGAIWRDGSGYLRIKI